jgi:hypothetical protein
VLLLLLLLLLLFFFRLQKQQLCQPLWESAECQLKVLAGSGVADV